MGRPASPMTYTRKAGFTPAVWVPQSDSRRVFGGGGAWGRLASPMTYTGVWTFLWTKARTPAGPG
jgi:hypothetical protein